MNTRPRLNLIICIIAMIGFANAQSPEPGAALPGGDWLVKACAEATRPEDLVKMFSSADRPFVKVLAAGGICGQYTPLALDMQHSSDSMIFSAVKGMTQKAPSMLLISVRQPDQPFDCEIGKADVRKAARLVPCPKILGRKNYVSALDGVPGQFLPLVNGQPIIDDVIYTVGSMPTAYIAADQSIVQLAITEAHEVVCHARRWMAGEVWRHPDVDKCVKSVEREAEENAREGSASDRVQEYENGSDG